MREDQADRLWRQELEDAGMAVAGLNAIMGGKRDLMVDVTGLSIRGPNETSSEFLGTVKALDEEGGPVVAFHSASSVGEVLVGIHARLMNGTLRWRPDEYRR